MSQKQNAPVLVGSNPGRERQTTCKTNHTPHVSLFNDRELKEVGYVRTREGYLADNRDNFYDENPDDYLRVYDCRTYVAVSRSLIAKMIRALGVA